MQDMYANSNEGIVFQTRILVAAYGVKRNPWKVHPDHPGLICFKTFDLNLI